MSADDAQISVGDLRLLVPDFPRALRAANKSPKTVGIYADAARRMINSLGRALDPELARMGRKRPRRSTAISESAGSIRTPSQNGYGLARKAG